jgi:hypothetical protein
VVAAVDDFSAPGKLTYIPAQIDGELTDYSKVELALNYLANEINKASTERDRLKNQNNHK